MARQIGCFRGAALVSEYSAGKTSLSSTVLQFAVFHINEATLEADVQFCA